MGIITVDKNTGNNFVDNPRPDDMSFTTGVREYHPPHTARLDYRAILALTVAGCVSFLIFWIIYGFWKTIYCWSRNYDACERLNTAEPLVFALVFGCVVCLAVLSVGARISAYVRQSKAVAARTNLVLDRFGDQIPVNLFDRMTTQQFLKYIENRYQTANELELAIAPYKIYRGVNSLSNSNSNPSPNTAGMLPNLIDVDETIKPVLSSVWLDWINNKPHFMIAGKTDAGKSVTARAILAQRFVANSQFIIIDPQSNGWFNFATIGNGWKWGEIVDAIIQIHDEYIRRHDVRAEYLRNTNQSLPIDHFPRLNTVMDEAFEISKKLDTGASKTKINYWELYAETLGSSARIVNIGAGVLTQTANVEDIGLSGPLRNNFTRIAIDAISIKMMIKQEESDSARREQLYDALIGMQYPATTVVGMVVELLDRTGLDQISIPHVGSEHIWPFISNKHTPSNGRTNTTLNQLRELRAHGITRDQARNDYGLTFDNDDW